jgi:hypothetical protein
VASPAAYRFTGEDRDAVCDRRDNQSHWTHGGNVAAKEAAIEGVLSVVYNIPPGLIFAVRDANDNPSSIAVNALRQSGILVGFP